MSDCKHFGMCGGCAYRHIPYEKQLENKENEVKELIQVLNSVLVGSQREKFELPDFTEVS